MRSGGWVAGLVTVLYVVGLKSLFFLGGGRRTEKGLNRRRMEGKRNTMVMMFVGGVVLLFDGLLSYYSYSRKSTGWEFFPNRG